MDDTPDTEGLPPSLRFLKGLVIVLTLTMIVGVITVVAVIVTRMPTAMRSPLLLPDQITLPSGTTAQAVTMGDDWIGVVTGNDRFLIFDRSTGALRQDVVIMAP